MEKDKILQQIKSLPEKSRLLIGYDEMAKDLSEVMNDSEVVEGVVVACTKNISHMIKNSKIIRSFMAVTDKNIYVLTRGRKIYNNISLLENTIIIPRVAVVNIERKEIPTILKIYYDAELEITTTKETYNIYMGSNYIKYLPKDFMEKVGRDINIQNSSEIGNKCSICGFMNIKDAIYCRQCGNLMEKEIKIERKCPNCNNTIHEDMQFCQNCGTYVPKEQNMVCSKCGQKLKPETRFCPNCGTSIVKENKCSNCGKIVSINAKFCTNCGNIL